MSAHHIYQTAGFRHPAVGAISSRLPLVLGVALALCLGAPGFSQAEDTSGAETTAAKVDNRIELSVPLKLNKRYVGDITVRVDVAGIGDIDAPRLLELLEPLISKGAFEDLQLSARNRDMVSMTELSSDIIMVEFDPGLLEVNAALAVSSLGENNIGLAPRPSPEPSQFDAPENFTLGLGATVSQGYVFAGEDDDRFTPIRANFEGFAQLGGFKGAALFYGFDLDEGRETLFRRREIQLVKDFYKPAIRASMGDINAPITAFQGTPPLMGLSVAREYRSIQPFRNIVSSGRGSLVLERDSKVDVFVNGVLSETLNLPAGRFFLTDFPVATGSNDVQLVVEDDTGRVETTAFSFFSQSGLLGEGLVDFAVTAGVPRSPSSGGITYGSKPIATGFVNYGLLSWLTTGLNAQARDERQQVGASLGIGTPVGLITADAAQSFGQGGLSGSAIGLDYQHNFLVGTSRVLTNASLIRKTRDFGTLGLGPVENTKFAAQGLIRTQLENGLSLGLSGSWRDEVVRPDEFRANFNLGKAFNNFYFNLSSDYIVTDGEDDAFEVTLGLTRRVGERYTARTQYATRNDTKLLELVRTRRRQLNDVSGRLQLFQSDLDNRLLSELNFRHNRFDGELDFDITDPRGRGGEPTSSEAKWRFSTFAGFTGGAFGFGRRSDEGFVIATRHKSLKDSDVKVLDQSGRLAEARVGFLGPALVPIERAYTPREYRFEVDPLPDGYDIGAGQISVLPGLGMGYSYRVGSDASRTVLGTVKNAEGKPLKLAVGKIVDVSGDESKTRQFFTNSAGRMVAERISAGIYYLIINEQKSDPIEIGEDTEGLVNVGEIILP